MLVLLDVVFVLKEVTATDEPRLRLTVVALVMIG